MLDNFRTFLNFYIVQVGCLREAQTWKRMRTAGGNYSENIDAVWGQHVRNLSNINKYAKCMIFGNKNLLFFSL